VEIGLNIVAERAQTALVASQETVRMARTGLRLAVDRESGVRGYLVTRDQRSLAPDIAARAQLPLLLDSLRDRTPVSHPAHAHVDSVRMALERWSRNFAEPSLSGAVLRDAGSQLAGKPLFDDIRRQFEELIADHDAAMRASAAQGRKIRRASLVVTLVEVLGLVAILFVLGRVLRVQAERLASERRKLDDRERLLLERRQERDALVGALSDLVLVVDADGCYVDIPQTAATWAMPVAVGQRIHDILPPANADAALADLQRVLANGEKVEMEQHFEIKGRMQYATATITRMAPDRAVIVVRDRTQERETENQLRQSQKMEAIGQLASSVAHDFNNVLTVISGCAELLSEEVAADSQAAEDVEEIRKASARAAALTRQLLAFSRKQVLQPRALDLSHTLLGLEPMLRRLIGADVQFAMDVRSSRRVMADPGQIEQIVLNLVVNARDAMPDGGTLTVETADVILHADGASLPPGDYVSLVVRDTGTGIPDSIRARIFEPFFTTKDAGRGTGLGLATVHSIVRQSGGHLALASVVGEGTTFTIHFPAVADNDDSISADAEARGPEAPPTTVLLVEDEVAVRLLARRVLQSRGHTVFAARHGRDALRIWDEHAPEIGLVLTDVVMPEMGGRALHDELLRRGLQTPVLFMSGYTDDPVLQSGMTRDGAGFLQKPFTASELIEAVHRSLEAFRR
jgi:signal transduction histidine kinase/ActR/RegA family two-component response regulator